MKLRVLRERKRATEYTLCNTAAFYIIYIYIYCKLYWIIKQDIPNGTSANGTRSPMRGTLLFYKLIKLQNIVTIAILLPK